MGGRTMTLAIPTTVLPKTMTSVVSTRTHLADAAFAAVRDFYVSSRYAQHRNDPDICDFTFGNPHEMPLAGIVSAIRERAVPRDKNWFAYKTSEQDPRLFWPSVLGASSGSPSNPRTLRSPRAPSRRSWWRSTWCSTAGDEVVFSEPAWFCYEPMLLAADLVPRKVRLKGPEFDLDLDAIEAAIGPKTRLVIVNTPHNPTGRIYGRDTLEALADLLERASARFGRRIFLLSDEPYRRLDSTDAALSVRPRSIPGRSSPTATARCCSPRAAPRLPRALSIDAVERSAGAARRDVLGANGARLVFSQRRDAVRGARP